MLKKCQEKLRKCKETEIANGFFLGKVHPPRTATYQMVNKPINTGASAENTADFAAVLKRLWVFWYVATGEGAHFLSFVSVTYDASILDSFSCCSCGHITCGCRVVVPCILSQPGSTVSCDDFYMTWRPLPNIWQSLSHRETCEDLEMI